MGGNACRALVVADFAGENDITIRLDDSERGPTALRSKYGAAVNSGLQLVPVGDGAKEL